MLHQLEKSDIDDRLIYIIRNFFTEKSKSDKPKDLENLHKLATDIKIALSEHSDLALRVALLQRFIMYGVNHPHLVSYYHDAFTRLSKTYKPKEKRKLVRYLIKKTQVAEYYCFYPENPSLLEAIHTQLRAWINEIDRKKYHFDSLNKSNPTPYIQLQRPPAIFMQITRLMAETQVFKRTENQDLFFDFLSRIIISKSGKKYSPVTLKNSHEYRKIEDLQTTIRVLEEMKQIAEDKLDEILRK